MTKTKKLLIDEATEIIQSEKHKQIITKYEKQLKNYTNQNSKKLSKKYGDEKESAYRICLLRESLGLTLPKMAKICSLPVSKLTRLEAGGTDYGTPLAEDDATRICFYVLKHFGILIEREWLLCFSHETPASLLSTKEMQKRVEEYTQSCMIDRNITGTVSIFLEMHHLEKIHGEEQTKFVMVSDNRLSSKYQKGDYVGGLLVQPQLYYLLDGYECIVSLTKEPDVHLVRNVYFKTPNRNADDNDEQNTITNQTVVLLCTETKDPEILSLKQISQILIIFCHRKNNTKFNDILGAINSANIALKK